MDSPEDNQNEEPASARKKASNRENAERSTGPRSLAGKQLVSKNAIKHGLRGRTFKFQDEEEKKKKPISKSSYST